MVRANSCATWNLVRVVPSIALPYYDDGNRVLLGGAGCIGTTHHQDDNVLHINPLQSRHDGKSPRSSVDYSKTMVENYVRTLGNYLQLTVNC